MQKLITVEEIFNRCHYLVDTKNGESLYPQQAQKVEGVDTLSLEKDDGEQVLILSVNQKVEIGEYGLIIIQGKAYRGYRSLFVDFSGGEN